MSDATIDDLTSRVAVGLRDAKTALFELADRLAESQDATVVQDLREQLSEAQVTIDWQAGVINQAESRIGEMELTIAELRALLATRDAAILAIRSAYKAK